MFTFPSNGGRTCILPAAKKTVLKGDRKRGSLEVPRLSAGFLVRPSEDDGSGDEGGSAGLRRSKRARAEWPLVSGSESSSSGSSDEGEEDGDPLLFLDSFGGGGDLGGADLGGLLTDDLGLDYGLF